jgi:hypothetical protein
MGDVGVGDISVSIDDISCYHENYPCANLSELCIIAILRKGFLSVDTAASISLKIPDVRSTYIFMYIYIYMYTYMLQMISCSDIMFLFREHFLTKYCDSLKLYFAFFRYL